MLVSKLLTFIHLPFHENVSLLTKNGSTLLCLLLYPTDLNEREEGLSSDLFSETVTAIML